MRHPRAETQVHRGSGPHGRRLCPRTEPQRQALGEVPASDFLTAPAQYAGIDRFSAASIDPRAQSLAAKRLGFAFEVRSDAHNSRRGWILPQSGDCSVLPIHSRLTWMRLAARDASGLKLGPGATPIGRQHNPMRQSRRRSRPIEPIAVALRSRASSVSLCPTCARVCSTEAGAVLCPCGRSLVGGEIDVSPVDPKTPLVSPAASELASQWGRRHRGR